MEQKETKATKEKLRQIAHHLHLALASSFPSLASVRLLLSAAVLLLAQVALAAGPEVRAKPLSGPSTEGSLAALSAGGAVLQTTAGEKSIPTAELMWLEFVRESESGPAKPTIWVELLDGSQLHALSYVTSAGQAQIALACGVSTELPVRAVRTVRFHQQISPALAAQWREIASGMASGDILVVRKTSTTTPPPAGGEANNESIALDQVEGVLLDVSADTVRFEIDGEKLDVRREKLEGIVYYRPHQSEFNPPLCLLKDAAGSSWLVRELILTAGGLRTTSVGNVPIEWPFASIDKLDFSIGNVRFLADIEPDSGDGASAVSLQPGGMLNKFGRIFQVRSAPPFGAGAFSIGGERFDSGLSLHSPLALVYRVPENFRRLKAAIGVDDSIVIPGHFELVIQGDGRELLRQAFSPEQSRKALPIDLDVSRIRRISIILDPLDGQDIGDQLDLCEARFTK